MSFKAPPWLRFYCVYVALMLAGNLIWEVAQLPLFTIWAEASPREIAFAVIHCTIGDSLIAIITLRLGLVSIGDRLWPQQHFWQVASLTILLGLGYTAFSEWFNTVVRGSWTYSEQMPVLALFDLRLGLSPLLQWVLVPLVAMTLIRRISWKQ